MYVRQEADNLRSRCSIDVLQVSATRNGWTSCRWVEVTRFTKQSTEVFDDAKSSFPVVLLSTHSPQTAGEIDDQQ